MRGKLLCSLKKTEGRAGKMSKKFKATKVSEEEEDVGKKEENRLPLEMTDHFQNGEFAKGVERKEGFGFLITKQKNPRTSSSELDSGETVKPERT